MRCEMMEFCSAMFSGGVVVGTNDVDSTGVGMDNTVGC